MNVKRFPCLRLLIVAVVIYLIPGIVWWVNYWSQPEQHLRASGPESTGLLAAIFLLLFFLASFIPPAALLIWGPLEIKGALIAYFVLSYGLLFIWTRKFMQKYSIRETEQE